MILLCQGSRGDNYLRVSVIQEKRDAIFNIGETENVSKYVRTMNQKDIWAVLALVSMLMPH